MHHKDKFECEKCGACCTFVKCTMLTEDKLCSIYDERPDVCNVRTMYEHRKLAMSFKEYCRISKQCCKQIRRMNVHS